MVRKQNAQREGNKNREEERPDQEKLIIAGKILKDLHTKTPTTSATFLTSV